MRQKLLELKDVRSFLMFIAALFTIIGLMKKPRCSSAGEYHKSCEHNTQAIKKPFVIVQWWMNLEPLPGQ